MHRRDQVSSEQFLLKVVNGLVQEPVLRQSLRRDVLNYVAARVRRDAAITPDNAANNDNVQTASKAFEEVRQKNAAHLRHVLKIYGWPTRAMVGLEGATAANRLALLSDGDLPLQKQCLAMMIEAGPSEVPLDIVARLTDRVLLAEGKPQRYGTQFHTDADGVYGPSPIEDETNVDTRRAEMGLDTLLQQKADAQKRFDRWSTDESTASTE